MRHWMFIAVGVCILFCGVGPARADVIAWDVAAGDWNVPTNWTPQQVPNVNGADDAVITNGGTVTWPSNTLGDFTLNGGSALTVAGGSTWQQTENTHWTRINTGTLVLDGATFSRPVGGNVVLPFDNGASGHLVLTNGAAMNLAGELWLGNAYGRTNQTGHVDISGSTIDALALWFWDPDNTGNDLGIDFSGLDIASITVDWLGRRDSVHGQQNDVTWETLWDEGLLTVVNQSGLTGWEFSDYFYTTGNPGPFNGDYTLQFTGIPEPATLSLLALGALGLLRRRCRPGLS